MYIIDRIGFTVVGSIRYCLLLLGLFYLSIKVLWTDRDLGQRDFWRQVLHQIYFTGVQAAGYVFVLGLGVGAFVIVKGVGGIGSLSGADSFGRLVTVAVIREIAPLITGGVIIARSVTAITAELGVMRVQREIEALEVMGISPIRHLITPRIFGGLISMIALNVLFGAVALFGGFVISQFIVSIPVDLFMRSVFSAISPIDLFVFSLKIILGGIVLFLIACYHGLSVDKAPTEVPVAVSKASLSSFVFLVVFHGMLSISLLIQSEQTRLWGVL